MQSGTPFAGFRIRLIYGALGLALCAICATGVNIWLIRRRERGTGSAMWGRLWIAVVWGQPLALALAALVALRFDPLLPYVTLTLRSCCSLLLPIAAMTLRGGMRLATALALALLAGTNVFTHGIFPADAMAMAVNMALFAGSLSLGLSPCGTTRNIAL